MAVVSGRWGVDVMSRLTAIISSLVICIIVRLSLAVNHYRDNAITYKEQRDKKSVNWKQATATITDMQQRQRDADALDAKYTKELADAKAENDALRRKLDNGGRVLVKGKCPVSSSAETSSASGMGMMPPSNSLRLLDETFSVSGTESSATKQH